jgi:hypothetical protein
MKSKRMIIPFLASVLFAFTVSAAPADPLETGFLNPPDSAKPQTWWHWMNGNITTNGIAADLEAMKQIGLGGATIVNVDCGIPRGPVNFMSPEWREDFKFAMQEASRLGLEMGVENCAGWTTSFGPWITVTNAMQRVTTSEVRVTGPTNFSAALPQPPTTLDFYRDIAVLAFPAPDDVGMRMKNSAPVASASGGGRTGNKLTDGDAKTFIRLPVPTRDRPQFAQLEFREPFPAHTVKIVGGPGMPDGRGEIQVSLDGRTFGNLRSFAIHSNGFPVCVIALGTQPVIAANFWRVQFTSAAATATEIPLAEIELTRRLTIDNLEMKAGMKANAGFYQDEVPSSPETDYAPDGAVQRRDVVDLTSKLTADGRLNWRVPAGEWVILRLGYTPTGPTNHPAPAEGDGLECDKLSKAALDTHWAGYMQKVFDDIGPLTGKTLDSSLIDSYEAGGQNWTENFRAEFLKRRGYDPLKFLPAFTDRVVDSPAVSERFLWDVRRTIADLFAENFYGHFAELCHQYGLMSAIEPYTGPFESLQSGAPADVVMGEFWSGTPGHPSVKLAASVAHIYGKTIVGAESFTAWPQNGRWQNDPVSLKTLGDLMFCQGLNRCIFHRYAMQPWTNRWPGMTMGQWGFHFERTVTWWNQGKPWIDYLTHCQFLLQQGRAVADAAYFTGESAPVDLRVCKPPLPAGYDYDAVDADVLLHGAAVTNGRLTLASGASYAVLILPPDDVNMTPQMLECIRELVRAGATVVGPRPQHSPSLADYPQCDAQVKTITDELWGKCDGRNILENSCGKGRVIWGKALTDVFAGQNLKPDFEFHSDSDVTLLARLLRQFSGASDATNLAYVHRVAGAVDIYFVSNQRRQFDSADCTFRVSGKVPELWHPDTGVIEPAPVWSAQNGRTTVRLDFDPAGSVFVIFRHAASGADHAVTAKTNPQWQTALDSRGELIVKATSNGKAGFRTAAGKKLNVVAANIPDPQEITGAWNLSFPPNWGAPPSVTLDKLISWTDHTNVGVRYFSGTATYEKEIEIPADRLSARRELWLDLGAVKNFAEVSLNGQDFGVLWKPPFRVNVTAAAKPGVNKLVVKVTNLWPNRLIGDEQLPPDVEWNGQQLAAWPQWLLDGKPSPTGRLTFTTWHHWTKDDTLLESGLLGPVTLQTAEIISAN